MTAMPSRRLLWSSLLFAVPLAIGACGGDDDDAAARPDPTAGTAPLGTSSTLGTPSQPTLLEAAGGAPAAEGAGLEEPPGAPGRTPLGDFGEAALAVTTPDGETAGWCVLLALTLAQRQQGLMEVTDLGGYDGMVFAFPEDNDTGFWMMNTVMPLSIAWFEDDGDLVSTADMAPCTSQTDCPTYPPTGSYRFALEVPQGELGRLGVEEGSTIALGGDCA
jgi:uncharacterized protein